MSDTPPRSLSKGRLTTPTDLGDNAVKDISAALSGVLADAFALYFKTKNFHWHMSGPHFRDYHLMMDEHAAQIFAATDDMAERARKIGGTTLRSINQAAARTRIAPNEADYVEPADMLAELMADTKGFIGALRAAHGVCDEHGDTSTASFIDTWIDEAERRTWFLYEALRPARTAGH